MASETQPNGDRRWLVAIKKYFGRGFRNPGFIVEILALVGLFWYVCETRRTNDLTQKALANSKTQFDQAQSASWKQFITDQRPYLWITNDMGPFAMAPQSTGNTSGKLAYNFHIMNYGRSPAINCKTEGLIIFGLNGESKISFQPLDSSRSNTIVPPGRDIYQTAWSDNPVESVLLTRIQTAGIIEHVTVAGYVEYSDTSGNMYSSEFCIERNPNLSMVFCEGHNSIK
jgi:hypothetical protein